MIFFDDRLGRHRRSTAPRPVGPKTLLTWMLLATAGAILLATPAISQGEPTYVGDQERVIVKKRIDGLPCSASNDIPGLKRVQRAFLGLELTRLTPELRRHFGVPDDSGVLIGQVVDDSAAFLAGLRVGDILTRVDGQVIAGPWDLSNAVRERSGGDTIDLEYWRDGQARQMIATLGEKDSCIYDLSFNMEMLENLDFQLEGLQDLPGLEISQEALEQALEALGSMDWEEQFEIQIEALEELELEQIDVRMDELQEQLEELKERMSREGERLGRDVERQLRHQMRALEEQESAREHMREEMQEERERVRESVERAREAHMQALEDKESAQDDARRARREAERELREELDRARQRAEEEEEGGGLFDHEDGSWVI